MKKLSLRPYHGEVWVFDKLKKLRAAYTEHTGEAYPYTDDPNGGRFIMIEKDSLAERVFLVYGRGPAELAHEFAHILLIVSRTIGYDPTQGDGEPFCYMLSQLMLESE